MKYPHTVCMCGSARKREIFIKIFNIASLSTYFAGLLEFLVKVRTLKKTKFRRTN